MKRIAVIGAGAVGSIIGGALSKENDVTLVCREAHAKAISEKGLVIEGEIAGTFRPAAVTGTDGMPIQDIVIITVKAYDLDQAVKDSIPIIGPGTLLAIVQNGLWVLGGPMRVSFARSIIAVASMGATMIGPGHVRLVGKGRFELGCLDGRMAQPTLLAQLLRSAGFDAEVTDDIVSSVWRKALINAAVNPVTALTMAPNGSILNDPGYTALSRALFDEGFDVAMHWNALADDDVSYDDVVDVIKATANNRSSMLQDLERGRRTEIDAINGTICELAPDPDMVKMNSRIVKVVKAMESWR